MSKIKSYGVYYMPTREARNRLNAKRELMQEFDDREEAKEECWRLNEIMDLDEHFYGYRVRPIYDDEAK